MNIFKIIFGKQKKEEKKEAECWYNNHHEKEKGECVEPIEGASLSSPNQVYYSTAQQAAKHQN